MSKGQPSLAENQMRLLIRQRELVAIRDLLRRVSKFSLRERQAWLDENAQTILHALSIVVENAQESMSEVPNDFDSLVLVNDLVSVLQETEQLADLVFTPIEAGLES